MPRCCITKYFLESLADQKRAVKITHYYDEEIPGFLLEHRGNNRGTWYFRYKTPEGKLRFCRLGSVEKLPLMEARAQAYNLYKMVLDGLDVQREKPRALTIPSLEDFVFAQYIPHAKMKKRSWELDQRILRLHILPTLGYVKIDKIRRSDILNWQQEMFVKGLAPGTCNRAFVLLKTVFNCAIRWGLLALDKNPCRGISLFEDTRQLERYLSPEEARKLLKSLDSSKDVQESKAIQLLLYTGARKQEILSARWEYVDYERHLLTVPLSKSGKTRYVPLSDEAIKILRSIPREKGSPWIFPQKNGSGPIRSVSYLWDRLRNELGLHDVRLHDLRHSFASFLVNAGCSLYEVQRCLGHYDPRVTMRYAHLNSKSLVNAANKVEQSVYHDPQ